MIYPERMYLSRPTHGDRIRECEAGRFAVYESDYRETKTLPPHYHEFGALLFSLRGSFAETVRRRTFECRPFDVLVRPAGEAHTNRYGRGGVTCVVIGVPEELSLQVRLFDAPATLPRAVAPIACRMAEELSIGDASSPVVMEGLTLEMIGVGSRRASRRTPPWLVMAQEFIHDRAADRVTLRDIARAANVGASSVVRAFRAHLHCSPGEYLRRVRVDCAKHALLSADQAIAEVALDAGFYDQSHFTNVFRRATGMTPAEYRNARRAKENREVAARSRIRILV